MTEARLEQELIAAAERIAVFTTPSLRYLCAVALGWLGAGEQAERLLAELLVEARAGDLGSRSSGLSTVSRAYSWFRCYTRAATIADELDHGGGDPNRPLEQALNLAEARLEAEQVSLAREVLGRASALLARVPQRFYQVQALVSLQLDAADPAAEETYRLACRLASSDFDRGRLVELACRMGRIEEAWTTLAAVDDPVSLAPALARAMKVAPERMDAMRQLIANVKDHYQWTSLLICAADGLAELPEYLAAADELIEEALEGLAGAPAEKRWYPLILASEALATGGEHGAAARYAHQALACLGPADFAANAKDRAPSTGRALARAGEREPAYRLLLQWIAQPKSDQWGAPLLVRDIAVTFEEPPRR